MSREMRAVVIKPTSKLEGSRRMPGALFGALISRSARTGVRRKRASLELQRLGVNAPSDYRQKRHAAHRLTFVPLPDRPVGICGQVLVTVTGGSSAGKSSQSAATVTQAGGMNVLPAFSYLVQAPVPTWRPWTRVWNSEASREERGRLITDLEPVGGGE